MKLTEDMCVGCVMEMARYQSFLEGVNNAKILVVDADAQLKTVLNAGGVWMPLRINIDTAVHLIEYPLRGIQYFIS